MAANSSSMQDDLSDIIPQQGATSKISPYLIMQAQKEVAAGKPGPNTHQLGMQALAQKHPAAMQGALASTQASAPTPANPAGAPGSAQGDPNAVAQSYEAMKGALPPTATGARPPAVMAEDTSKNQQNSMQKLMWSPEDIEKARGMAMDSPMVKLQEQGQEKLQDLLNARRQWESEKQGPDLTGLMMAADTANGTNRYTQGYKRPDMSATQQQLFQDEAEIQKQKQGTATGVEQSIRDILGGGTMNNLTSQILAQKISDPTGTNHTATEANQFARQANTLSKDVENRATVIDQGLRMLALGDSAADNKSRIELARAIEGTVRIHQADMAESGTGDRSLWERVMQSVQTADSGQLTPENRAQLANLFNTMRGSLAIDSKNHQDILKVLNKRQTQPFSDQELQPFLDRMSGHAGNMAANMAKMPHSQNQVKVTPQMGQPTGPQLGAGGPHGPTVTQGGHTYNWNPQTKKYE